MVYTPKDIGKRNQEHEQTASIEAELYVKQIAWGASTTDRKVKEFPSIGLYATWIINELDSFGFDEFTWANFSAYESKTGTNLLPFEVQLIRRLIIIYSNGKHSYSAESTPPPYMSDEFKKRRAKALKQVKELS